MLTTIICRQPCLNVLRCCEKYDVLLIDTLAELLNKVLKMCVLRHVIYCGKCFERAMKLIEHLQVQNINLTEYFCVLE